MKATATEINILNKLQGCRFLPGSFDKKFPRNVNPEDISPLQQWWIYKLGYKYRKQIKSDSMALVCKTFLAANPEQPLSRKESGKILKKAVNNSSQLELE